MNFPQGKDKGGSVVESLQEAGRAVPVWKVEMLGHTGMELCSSSEPLSWNLRITEQFELEGNFRSSNLLPPVQESCSHPPVPSQVAPLKWV